MPCIATARHLEFPRKVGVHPSWEFGSLLDLAFNSSIHGYNKHFSQQDLLTCAAAQWVATSPSTKWRSGKSSILIFFEPVCCNLFCTAFSCLLKPFLRVHFRSISFWIRSKNNDLWVTIYCNTGSCCSKKISELLAFSWDYLRAFFPQFLDHKRNLDLRFGDKIEKMLKLLVDQDISWFLKKRTFSGSIYF